MRSLENYPELEEYIADISSAKDIDLSSFHVSLGPSGSFYINSNRGQYRGSLDNRLNQEITERVLDGHHVGDPVSVALGVDGSYVLVGSKGDTMWDLKGQYGSLDEQLQNAKFGVRVRTTFGKLLHPSRPKLMLWTSYVEYRALAVRCRILLRHVQ